VIGRPADAPRPQDADPGTVPGGRSVSIFKPFRENRITMDIRLTRSLMLAAGLLAAAPAAALAQRPPAPADTAPRFQIEGVTVTVGRDTIRRDALPRRIEVITATDIARTAADDVAQLLRSRRRST